MQFDALIERLTGRELLTMFARLRGIPEGQIKEVVETEINRLDFSKHADKRCGRYRYMFDKKEIISDPFLRWILSAFILNVVVATSES